MLSHSIPDNIISAPIIVNLLYKMSEDFTCNSPNYIGTDIASEIIKSDTVHLAIKVSFYIFYIVFRKKHKFWWTVAKCNRIMLDIRSTYAILWLTRKVDVEHDLSDASADWLSTKIAMFSRIFLSYSN